MGRLLAGGRRGGCTYFVRTISPQLVGLNRCWAAFSAPLSTKPSVSRRRFLWVASRKLPLLLAHPEELA